MYPDSVLQWLGYLGLALAAVTVAVLIALTIHAWSQRTHSLQPREPDDEIPDRLDDLPD